MELSEIRDRIPAEMFGVLSADGISRLTPCQEKSVDAGLLSGKSILACTPTASGKTLVAELASVKAIADGKGKAVYIVPLKALASEKYREFKRKYGSFLRVALSIGDLDSPELHLAENDLIVCTAEKLDSVIRHGASWLKYVAVVVVDEVHLLNDAGRGPTLEILLTIIRKLIPDVQIIALSATIGNPGELAEWLGAELVLDSWRPVVLKKGVHFNGKISFEENS